MSLPRSARRRTTAAPMPPEPPATSATPALLEKSGTVTASQSEGLGDDDLHDLAGPGVDAGDARIRVQPGDGVFQHVSVAAEQLQAAVDRPGLHLGAEQLDLGGVRTAHCA